MSRYLVGRPVSGYMVLSTLGVNPKGLECGNTLRPFPGPPRLNLLFFAKKQAYPRGLGEIKRHLLQFLQGGQESPLIPETIRLRFAQVYRPIRSAGHGESSCVRV